MLAQTQQVAMVNKILLTSKYAMVQFHKAVNLQVNVCAHYSRKITCFSKSVFQKRMRRFDSVCVHVHSEFALLCTSLICLQEPPACHLLCSWLAHGGLDGCVFALLAENVSLHAL